MVKKEDNTKTIETTGWVGYFTLKSTIPVSKTKTPMEKMSEGEKLNWKFNKLFFGI